MKDPAKHLPKYRKNLARYEREGDHEKARIERALIAKHKAKK